MEYNVKLSEHGNGTIQIKTYSSKVRKLRKRSKSTNTAIEHLELYGFGKCREISIERWNETPAQREARKALNLYNSVCRTKKKINELARACEWEYFVTLTFAPDKINRTDFKLCMSKVRSWLNNQRKHYAPDLKYLAVPEMHKKVESNGMHAWHIHILLADVGNMSFTDTNKVAVGKKAYDRTDIYKDYPTIYNLSGWRWGFSTAIPITSNEGHRIPHYIVKYITKEMYVHASGAHKYYASQNLNKPTTHTYDIPDTAQAAFIKAYTERHDKKIVYQKEVSKYIDTTFYELESNN